MYEVPGGFGGWRLSLRGVRHAHRPARRRSDGTHSVSVATVAANQNTLSYQEDRNSRRFEASLTDSAMHGLGDVFGELFAQRGVGRTLSHSNGRNSPKNYMVLDLKQLPPAPPDIDHIEIPAEKKPLAVETNKDRVLKIFSLSGDILELTDNRLKATSAADYYRRLTYLFLYAHELHGRSATPKADLVNVLKEAKVYDTNCRTWLKQKKGFKLDADERLKLIAGAREQAVNTG